ncbi:hypothetical protein [Halomonas elongata]|uniref:hypothetical protein n=1 Tax=Halomonas elongata TaxID=2746 RepID=UPI00186B7E8E|nr:hypothetical protein [Halomonas elongata]MBW5800638.1 hypothetical protein [Halomonas elongata]
MPKRNRNRKLTQRQKNTMASRSQRAVSTVYVYRRGSWEQGGDDDPGDRYGFLAPVHPSKRPTVLRMAHLAPQHWEITCIVYCRAQDGSEYRETAAVRTSQKFAAWLERRDESGKIVRDDSGQPVFDDQLSPIIRDTMEAAEAGCNPNHIVDRGVILRPWSRNWPSVIPVLKRLRDELDLTDSEIEEFQEWEAA